jgi:uncharacterized protein YbjT (DUF2867 family)
MTSLILGATGTVGKALVNSLVKEYNAQKIRLLVRDIEKATKLFSHLESGTTKIEYVKGDFTNIVATTDAFTGVERLFVLTQSAPQQQKELEEQIVKIALDVSSDLKQIVKLSALATDVYTENDSLARWQAECESVVTSLAEQKKVNHTILRPNLFLQNFLTDDLQSIQEQGVFYRPGLSDNVNYRISHVDARDIGVAAAAVLTQDPVKHNGKIYNITGPESLTFEEVAAIISKKLGKNVQVVHVDDRSLYQLMIQYTPDWLASLYVEMYQSMRMSSAPHSIISDDYQILTNKKPTTVEQFFEDHKHVFH